MRISWPNILSALQAYPEKTHNIRPPCPEEQIARVENELGKMPAELSDMLLHFNGAILFDAGAGGELVTLFGVTENPPLSALEWAPDWYIDKFTPKWRAVANGRESDWVIAIMNYGGLIVLTEPNIIRVWDSSKKSWSTGSFLFSQWIENLLQEGAAYLNEE